MSFVLNTIRCSVDISCFKGDGSLFGISFQRALVKQGCVQIVNSLWGAKFI